MHCLPFCAARPAISPVVVAAEKTAQGKKQEVFLGVKGNAQLLGMKGADVETNIWKIRVQLMKPVTWIPLIWGECCWTANGPKVAAAKTACSMLSGTGGIF